MNELTPVLAILLGAGGAGGLVTLVAALRSWQKGKIEDEESLIKRLDEDNKRQHERSAMMEVERDTAVRMRHRWQDQAYRYRNQLIAADVEPHDVAALWREEANNV